MRVSLSGCRPGICTTILAARPLASTVGYRFADDAAVQAERDHAVVAQLPHPSLWVPYATGLLHPVAHCHVGKGDAEPDDLVVGEARWWRLPVTFGDDDSTVLNRFFRCAS